MVKDQRSNLNLASTPTNCDGNSKLERTSDCTIAAATPECPGVIDLLPYVISAQIINLVRSAFYIAIAWKSVNSSHRLTTLLLIDQQQ